MRPTATLSPFDWAKVDYLYYKIKKHDNYSSPPKLEDLHGLPPCLVFAFVDIKMTYDHWTYDPVQGWWACTVSNIPQ